MPVFSIQHITTYSYDRPVKESINRLLIFPINDQRQKLLRSELFVTGDPAIESFVDAFGNTVGDFTMAAPHRELMIDHRVTVSTHDDWLPPVNNPTTRSALQSAVHRIMMLHTLAEPERIESQDKLDQILASLAIEEHTSIQQIAERCCGYIFNEFTYEKGITTVSTTVDEIMEHRSGVCQDFAHVLLQLLRTMGVPGRYVSGYICPNKSGMRGEGATHAWVEYYLPGEGWVGLDPTNNVFAGSYHVRLATGRNFKDCTPVKGTFKGIAHQTLTVFVSVGFEDGHVVENLNDVHLEEENIDGVEPWQEELIAKQQLQQQQ